MTAVESFEIEGVPWQTICALAMSQCADFPEEKKAPNILFMSPRSTGTRRIIPTNNFRYWRCHVLIQLDKDRVWFGFSEEQVDIAFWGPKCLRNWKKPEDSKFVFIATKIAPDNWTLTYMPPAKPSLGLLRAHYAEMMKTIFPGIEGLEEYLISFNPEPEPDQASA